MMVILVLLLMSVRPVAVLGRPMPVVMGLPAHMICATALEGVPILFELIDALSMGLVS